MAAPKQKLWKCCCRPPSTAEYQPQWTTFGWPENFSAKTRRRFFCHPKNRPPQKWPRRICKSLINPPFLDLRITLRVAKYLDKMGNMPPLISIQIYSVPWLIPTWASAQTWWNIILMRRNVRLTQRDRYLCALITPQPRWQVCQPRLNTPD